MTTKPLSVSPGGLAVLAEQVGEAQPATGTITDSSGVPVPAWVAPGAISAAEELAAAELATLTDHFTARPESPASYQMLPPLPGEAPIPAEEIVALRGAAHSIGVSAGEFRNLQTVLARIVPAAGDPKMEKRAADVMGKELDRRFGEDRAAEIAGYAVGAIKNAKGLPEGVARALRQEILTNRPLLLLLARIGERHVKQKR